MIDQPTPTPDPLSPFDQWRLLCRAVEQIDTTSAEWERAEPRTRRSRAKAALDLLQRVYAAADADLERQLTDNYHRRLAEQYKEPT